MAQEGKKQRVVFTFNRELSEAELKEMQLKIDALEAVAAEGHHDHDHPSIVADFGIAEAGQRKR